MAAGRPDWLVWCGIVVLKGSGPSPTTMTSTILVVDDEKNIVQLTRLYLAMKATESKRHTTASRRWKRRALSTPT